MNLREGKADFAGRLSLEREGRERRERERERERGRERTPVLIVAVL